ncbi:aerial mycelium formation [Rubrobacter xylanophilus DSM 9941]|uniref:Aerial mycelium formation n=1 Tax=Rubrobacter xylanophilus (strain DSM 9941 / JCM 11954 / NBRC 16129 / PRD-1) TaxID=266117 RepID=Q1AW31_RUBXD|nr:hypothetical protein [Rubrobacter xylanophilus]ABG04397.1 aerial mycelium formation [Rubrobacter xylanophilus DSM 9941]
MGELERGGFDWEGAGDITALSPEELRRELRALEEEERELSRRRRVLHGRIDLLRAELVRRGGAALSPEELARVLSERRSSGEGGRRHR